MSTAGYHGSAQTLATNSTYETIFDVSAVSNVRPVWGMEFWCTGSDIQILFDKTSAYGTGSDQYATVVADEAPVRFYFDNIQTVKVKAATVAGMTFNWRTIGA